MLLGPVSQKQAAAGWNFEAARGVLVWTDLV